MLSNANDTQPLTIKGKRWIENPRDKIPFNDSWVYPKLSETPEKKDIVEAGCYW